MIGHAAARWVPIWINPWKGGGAKTVWAIDLQIFEFPKYEIDTFFQNFSLIDNCLIYYALLNTLASFEFLNSQHNRTGQFGNLEWPELWSD